MKCKLCYSLGNSQRRREERIGEMRERKGKGRKYKVEEKLRGREKKGEGTKRKKVS